MLFVSKYLENENNLKLSNIYFSDFDNLHLSADKLVKVLSNNPNNEQKVNALYKMYTIYEKEKNLWQFVRDCVELL